MNLQLLHGDCLDLMAGIPDGSVDLVLCDLPYGTTRNSWDSVLPLEPLWSGYLRVARGPIVLTAAQPFTSHLVVSGAAWFRYEWVWVKNKASGHLNAKKRPLAAHESVLVFSPEAPRYFPQKSSGHRPANFAKRVVASSNYGSQRDATYDGGNTDRYPTTVLPFAVVNNDAPDRHHPTQKPVALMEYLIRTYTNPGDTVLDNCMGSGTTGVAAVNTRRNFIGIEKDEGYFQIAKERIFAARASVVTNDNAAAPTGVFA